MKKSLLLCLLSCFLIRLGAQCGSSLASTGLQANNISTIVGSGGSLFNQNGEGFFTYSPTPGGLQPSTMYGANLWMGGLDPGGNLRLFINDYGYSAPTGPLDANGMITPADCSNWDRLFQVRGSEIDSFLLHLPTLAFDPVMALALYPEIMGWPGLGNPYFAAVWAFDLPFQPLAPFADLDQDGMYNPLKGDHPAVVLQNKPPFVPAEIIWSVYNDRFDDPNDLQIGLQVRQTIWAFNCADQPALNNTVFTSQKITYHGAYPLDSAFIGIWTDIDLGCGADDYIGCNPALDAYYGYNQDVTDGQPGALCDGGVTTFGDQAPVQSVTVLNRPMDRFMTYSRSGFGMPAATTDPSSPSEYYNYLTGSWRDGTPLTAGGSGYNPAMPGLPHTAFAFPDDPSDANGWSMCSANSAMADRRALGILEAGTLQPGHSEELTVAWSVHAQPGLPCNLGAAFNDILLIRSLFDEDFATVCSPLTTAPEAGAGSLELFPNPAAQSFTLRYGGLAPREIRIFDLVGRLILVEKNIPTEQTTVDVSGLSPALYEVRLLTAEGNLTRKLCVNR